MGRGLDWLYDYGDDDQDDVVATADVEPPTTIGARLPDVVVVPAHPRPEGPGFAIELSAEVSGEPVAIVFSTVERLVERLGGYQPWVQIRSETLPRLLGTTAISIVLDPLAKTCRAQWTGERFYNIELFQQGMEASEPVRGDIRA
ncbi:SAV_915 family protein [Nocardia sp. NPDC088792]|uniref:SAV_915 family protein n=1 Tax=Nocardia sp. NPDC088792 TaxID=3364332 RepID=UPI003820CC8C